ncbi:MAG: hypothetical protein KDD47_23775 [Acidobacteria bacterium]|nr:hypothetical protein [Acidobacteriota bacterium]
MRCLVALALLLASCAAPYVAGTGRLMEFPIREFWANDEIARWLHSYDWVAWHSSDLVLQESPEEVSRLGKEWFCFERENRWHAVYGRYEPDSETYQVVFHYVYDAETGFQPADDPAHEELFVAYGRALRNSLDGIPAAVAELGIRFNTYIRPLDDGRLSVWVLPGGQPDGTLIYGGELHFVFDSTGRELLAESRNFSDFYAASPDAELALEINRQGNEVPSVGDVFFVLNFRDQFESVTIRTRCFVTRMLEVDGEDAAWVQVHRGTPECGSTAGSRRPGEVLDTGQPEREVAEGAAAETGRPVSLL